MPPLRGGAAFTIMRTINLSTAPRKEFPCVKCGLCCQLVHLATETRFLDRGDGVCRHFDAGSKGCLIYEDRPNICRVDRQYDLHYFQNYSWDEFVAANLEGCQRIAKHMQP